MNIGLPEVIYSSIYDSNLEDIVGVDVSVKVPATDGDVSGYVVLGNVEGWTLSENNTKLSKTYNSNGTETITIPYVSFNGTALEGASTMESIEVYGINASEYVSSSVEYTLTDKTITGAIVRLKIKDGKTYNFDVKEGWILSEDKKTLTFNAVSNHNMVDTCVIYPSDQTHTAENEKTETYSYAINKIGLTIGTPVVSYSPIGEDATIGVKASILVPWTLGEKSGWATLGTVVNGWNSFDDNTKVTKTFYENTTETVTIPVLSCDDYDYSEMYIDVNVNVDQINYKKVVKGISEDSRCLYYTYTKDEMDNRELRKKDKEASSQDMVLASLTITTETDNQIINESVNYPEGFNMNNTYIVNTKCKARDENYARTDYIVSKERGDQVLYTDCLSCTYQSNAMYLGGRLPYPAGKTVDVYLLLVKAE